MLPTETPTDTQQLQQLLQSAQRLQDEGQSPAIAAAEDRKMSLSHQFAFSREAESKKRGNATKTRLPEKLVTVATVAASDTHQRWTQPKTCLSKAKIEEQDRVGRSEEGRRGTESLISTVSCLLPAELLQKITASVSICPQTH